MPTDALMTKELIENAVGMVTTIPLFGALAALFFSLGGRNKKKQNPNPNDLKEASSTPVAKTESDVERVGWANLRWSGKAPALYVIVVMLLCCYVVMLLFC
jgi:hypothetical protein